MCVFVCLFVCSRARARTVGDRGECREMGGGGGGREEGVGEARKGAYNRRLALSVGLTGTQRGTDRHSAWD